MSGVGIGVAVGVWESGNRRGKNLPKVLDRLFHARQTFGRLRKKDKR